MTHVNAELAVVVVLGLGPGPGATRPERMVALLSSVIVVGLGPGPWRHVRRQLVPCEQKRRGLHEPARAFSRDLEGKMVVFCNPNELFARLSCGITEFWGIWRANWSYFEPKRAVCSFLRHRKRILGGFPRRSCSDIQNQVSAYPSSLPTRPTCTEPPGSPRGSLSRQRKRGSRRKQCEYEASAIHCFVLGSKNAEG